MEFKQAITFLSALAFLGTAAMLLAACVAILAAGAIDTKRLSNAETAISRWMFAGWGVGGKIGAGAVALAGGYAFVLLILSFVSQTRVLGQGEEKYFCELDCHIANAVLGVTQAKTLGSGAHSVTAEGMFYVVTVRTRFDEHTISPHRGNGPLEPGPRVITIVGEQGREYPISSAGEEALKTAGEAGTPMTQPLRPSESYTTQLVFDLPRDARNPQLMIASPTHPEWIGRLLIGEETSFFHKKVLFRLS